MSDLSVRVVVLRQMATTRVGVGEVARKSGIHRNVLARWVDEYGPAWVVEEGESIVEWLRVRPADGGKVVMVCRDQCRRPTRAEVSGYGLDGTPRSSGRKSA